MNVQYLELSRILFSIYTTLSKYKKWFRLFTSSCDFCLKQEKKPVAKGIPLIYVHDFMLHVRLLPERISRTLDNNVLATEAAKKVNQEITESKKTILTR